MKYGSMNVLHTASIRKCFHKNPGALKNASNEIRKHEPTSYCKYWKVLPQEAQSIKK